MESLCKDLIKEDGFYDFLVIFKVFLRFFLFMKYYDFLYFRFRSFRNSGVGVADVFVVERFFILGMWE